MAKKRQIDVQFPLGGLNRKSAHRQQPPFTSSELLNVRPIDTIQGRERGGSRPGLIETHYTDLGGPVRLLAPMVLSLGDGFTAWSDTFGGLAMADAWTQASWADALPSILPSALAGIDTSVDEAAAVLDALTIDTADSYSVEAFLTPWNGAFHGKYRLYLRMDDTTPDIETDGIMVELVMDDDSGDYSGTLTRFIGGVQTDYALTGGTLDVARPGWLTALVVANTISVYWNGVLLKTQAVGAPAGSRVGFGLKCTEDGGLCLVNVFRVQYYSTGSISALRSMLVASAAGDLFTETFYGTLTQIVTDLTLRDDATLQAAQSGQQLFIADYGDVATFGTDGTVAGDQLTATAIDDWTALGIDIDDMVCVISDPLGTAVAGTYAIDSLAVGALTLAEAAGAGACAYRIERAPKVYDPLLGTLSIMAATDGVGQVPTGCPLICRYLDRIVLAGAEIAPHVWYMSRQGDPLDWDYSQEDSQRAVAGTSSAAGVPGDAIVALAVHSDDYLIMGCRNSLWRLAGDPAYGGTLNVLSQTVGIIGPKAWCLGPAGELVFLSMNGIYVLPPGGNSYPVPISDEPIPREFRNLNPDTLTASLEYDVQDNGVHIYLTQSSPNSRVHWWLDWSRKTFWPVSLAADHEPTATCALQATAIEESGVLLGCGDGYLRRFSDLAETDCGEAYETYAVFGPIALAKDAQAGRVLSIDAVMAEGSGDVTWELVPSLTFEGVLSVDVSDTGTWEDGINATEYPACRGQAFSLVVTGSSGRRWAVEQITAVLAEAGRRRID